MSEYERYRRQLQGLSFPYAVLDADLFAKNIQLNLERSGAKNIRIASKSLRCVETMRVIVDTSSQFQGIMTYHGREAITLAERGFDDLLMGYPVVNKSLLLAMGEQIKAGKQICFMVDSLEHLQRLNETGKRLNITYPICIDIDLSDTYPVLHFGVWRSSIFNLDDLERLLLQIKQLNHIRLEGLMGYEAQIAGVGDNVAGAGFKNKAVRWLKNRSIKHLRARRRAAVDLIRTEGFDLRFVNGGGTGSLESTTEEEVVTEVTVGSGFYNPHLFDYYQNFTLHPALFYAIEVVRKPSPAIYTCHGGGFIASGGIEKIKAPVVYLPETGKLDAMEGAGEVQTPITFDVFPDLEIGDPVFLRHAKAGEICERFTHLTFLENGATREVPTYRGEGWSFG